ncbi:TlpA disulfide reductase family protein [Hymenobacter swuensis]|uniref:Peroxiredoxin n=1 Tax=Hymenobacter swuensis DY53 TaxID=1227739 RepID=W8ER57_9BACT|nr:TlpA disulfide reductase family protein [Hymenobacter swuensis]AHJ95624.1 peroxiredoxin [Hymenobacter swuensis DY53]
MYSVALLALSGLLISYSTGSPCPVPPVRCQLSGTITGLGHQPIIFRYQQQGVAHADTVRAINDQFHYTARPSDDGLVELVIDRSHWTTFWYEPGNLQVSGNAAAPHQLVITGTPDNAILTQYHQQVEWPFEAKIRQALRAGQSTVPLRQQRVQESLDFVRKHRASRVAAEILLWQTRYDDAQLSTYQALYNQLPKPVQTTVQGREVARRLTILRDMPVVGKTAPHFTMPDTAGVATSLSSYQGRYILLDFWGHWCGPCLKAMPAVAALHQQYGKQVAFLGIAAESARDRMPWLRAIRKHQPAWPQLSELAGDESPVLTTYNITAFPTYLLLNPEGVVMARTSDLTELTQALASLPLK